MRIRRHDIAFRLIGYVYSPDRRRAIDVSLSAGGTGAETHAYFLVVGSMGAIIESKAADQAHSVSVKLRNLFDAGGTMDEIARSARVWFSIDMKAMEEPT
jgi:hypothetical protein